jgi:hypothetical protein
MILTTVLLMAAGIQAADTGGVKLRMDALPRQRRTAW